MGNTGFWLRHAQWKMPLTHWRCELKNQSQKLQGGSGLWGLAFWFLTWSSSFVELAEVSEDWSWGPFSCSAHMGILWHKSLTKTILGVRVQTAFLLVQKFSKSLMGLPLTSSLYSPGHTLGLLCRVRQVLRSEFILHSQFFQILGTPGGHHVTTEATAAP